MLACCVTPYLPSVTRNQERGIPNQILAYLLMLLSWPEIYLTILSRQIYNLPLLWTNVPIAIEIINN